MMKKISAILLFFVVVMSMTAKESGESIIRYSQNGTIRSVEFSKMKQDVAIPKSADAFFADILKKGASPSTRQDGNLVCMSCVLL